MSERDPDMGCCGQNTTGAGAGAVDTGKRVNYTQGMLLGVDDFVQDQMWHTARRHELAREVLGYGTVRGLQVAIEPGAPRVHVTPGMAWMPSGTPVCVPGEQCAGINEWLKAHWTDDGVGNVVDPAPQPAPLSLYVVLAYDTCLTDKVPVPGEPCRSEEDLTADSRIADCFRLELRTRAPDQVEEDAIRDFADWLAHVPVDTQSPPLSDEAFLAQLRDAAQLWLAPSSPHVGDFMFGSPPAGIQSTDDLIRAALRLWATELRPRWRARYGCGPGAAVAGGPDDAVLLAELRLRVYAATKEAEAAIEVVEDRRPVLMSLRMVQELLTQNPAPEPATTVVAEQSFGQLPAVGADSAYARADHTHGTPVLPALAGDVTGPIEGNEIAALQGTPVSAAGATDGQVLTVDAGTWVAATPGGDVEGRVDGLVVVGLQKVPVSAAEPKPGDVLRLAEVENPEGGTMNVWTPEALELPQASDQVPSAIVFPDEGTEGRSEAYARADHVHRFQTALEIDGDIGGTHTATTVERLQGVLLDARKPQAGEVLTLVQRESSDGGLVSAWMPQPAGSAQAGDETPTAVVAGTPADPGRNPSYSRSDHQHAFALPALQGDLAGSLGENRLARLQGRDVDAASPRAGDALAYTGTAWAAVPQVMAITAGKLQVALAQGKLVGTPGATLVRPMGNVKVVSAGILASAVCVRLNVVPSVPVPAESGFVLKLTPTLSAEWAKLILAGGDSPAFPENSPVVLAFAAGDPVVDARTGRGITFDIVLSSFSDLRKPASALLEVQFELGRYTL